MATANAKHQRKLDELARAMSFARSDVDAAHQRKLAADADAANQRNHEKHKSMVDALKTCVARIREARRPPRQGTPSTLHPPPSTLHPPTSTLNPQPSTLNPQPSTLNPPPSTPNPKP